MNSVVVAVKMAKRRTLKRLSWLFGAVLAITAVGAAEVAPPPPASRVVEGRVTNGEGKVISGARVTLLSSEGRTSVEVNGTETNSAGEFHLEGRASPMADDDLRWKVVAQAPGYGLTPVDVPAKGKCDVVMRERTEGKLVLTGENGAPLVGMRVKPVSLSGRMSKRIVTVIGEDAKMSKEDEKALSEAMRLHLLYPERMAEQSAQTSDDRGVCVFEGLPQGANLMVEIDDDRFARAGANEFLSLGANAAENVLNLKVIPSSVIEGVVRFARSGEPAAGVRVGAQNTDHDRGDAVWGDAVTDASGRFAVKRMRPGIYNVALDLRGVWEQQWTARAHENLELIRSETKGGIDFELITGAIIRGKVYDEVSGAPLQKLLIAVYGPARPRSGAWVQNVRTGAKGEYVLRVPPGAQYLYFQDMVPRGYQVPKLRERDITLADGEERQVDFLLRKE